ncbi:MAG: sulfite exporter TauE/SafE family protein [Candidatus Angelobacter sp.]
MALANIISSSLLAFLQRDYRSAIIERFNSDIPEFGLGFSIKSCFRSMIPAMTYLYILLGLVVGVFSGIVGIGGGILIIPALVYFFHMSQHKAQGTSLTALLAPIGALAFWEYYKAGNVDLKAGLLIALGFLLGGYFGGLWAQHLPEMVLRRAFGTLLTIIGIQLLLSRG